MIEARQRIVRPRGDPKTLWRSALQTQSALLPVRPADRTRIAASPGARIAEAATNSDGKTSHNWHTGLPFGGLRLMWSFNRDREADLPLHDEVMPGLRIDEGKKRRQRRDLARLAHPQHRVDLLKAPISKGRWAAVGGGRHG
jgi:Protein of unknown function (DUF1264)